MFGSQKYSEVFTDFSEEIDFSFMSKTALNLSAHKKHKEKDESRISKCQECALLFDFFIRPNRLPFIGEKYARDHKNSAEAEIAT